MRNLFKSFYKLNKSEYEILWKNAIFIFDTNILLNLYRYQSSTRDELLKVIEQLKDRIWIPNHVALEFQRNRLFVIAEQHKRYTEVQSIVSKSLSEMQNELDRLQLKKRHSHINPDKLVESMQTIKKEYFEELNKLEEKSISLSTEDKILERLDDIFLDKVGKAFEKQKELDDLFKEGEERFKKQIPPGYKDSKKDDKKPDDFTFGGLSYKRKFGDLIIWKQIIKYAKENKLKDIIFVTDDGKSDWWLKIDSNGTKTIGVRPELIDEITNNSEVERFHIYNTESFLNYANEQLNAQITKEAIEEVREVSYARQIISKSSKNIIHIARSVERNVFEWLSLKYSHVEENRKGFPDFISYNSEGKQGFEVKLVRDSRNIFHHLNNILHRAYYIMQEEDFEEITIIFVLLEIDLIERILHTIQKRISDFKGNIKILVGLTHFDEETGESYGFDPIEEFNTSRFM